MVTFDSLLQALYEIQGAADPNHPVASAAERLEEIYEKAGEMLEQSGFQPEPFRL